MVNCVPEYFSRSVLVLGCGNTLLGDDGFGPEVINCLGSEFSLPQEMALLDAGTAVGEVLLDLALSPVKPRLLILIDAADSGQPPGTLRFSKLERPALRPARMTSSHQAPTSILLGELQELGGVEVLLLTVQPEDIPEEIRSGLSPPVQTAVARATELILEFFSARKDATAPLDMVVGG